MRFRSKLVHVELAKRDRTCLTEPSHSNRIAVWNEIGKYPASVSCPHTGRVIQILMCDGDSVQRSTVVTCGQFGIQALGLQQSLFSSQGDKTVQV